MLRRTASEQSKRQRRVDTFIVKKNLINFCRLNVCVYRSSFGGPATHLVTATAISYTGSLRSLNRYFPMSVSAAAESIASLPTLFLSKYGVASLAWKTPFEIGLLRVRRGWRIIRLRDHKFVAFTRRNPFGIGSYSDKRGWLACVDEPEIKSCFRIRVLRVQFACYASTGLR